MNATDIGHGRGWLDAPAAASIARIDAQLGRPLSTNRAGASIQEQQEKYDAWRAYQAGTGPEAPLALPPSQSWHVQGLAVDTADPARAREMLTHGWRFQVAGEPWHGQYYPALDQHINDPAPQTQKEDAMGLRIISSPYYRAAKQQVVHNGLAAKPIPNVVAAALRSGGVASHDYNAEQDFNAEITEVWNLGNIVSAEAGKAMLDEFGDRISRAPLT